MEIQSNDVENKNLIPLEKLKNEFGYFALVSAAFGLLFAFCIYNNPCGVAIPVAVCGGYAALIALLYRLNIKIKILSWFISAVSVLLGLSICTTANETIQFLDKLGILILWCVFILHVFYQDGQWSLMKYMVAILQFLCQSAAAVRYPFSHGILFFRRLKDSRIKTLLMCLVGFWIGITMLFILIPLLGSADMIFQYLSIVIIKKWLNPATIAAHVFLSAFGTLALYSMVCGACMHKINEQETERRCVEAPIASTCLSVIGVIYLAFSLIQIIYLFMGKGRLPYGISYSQYAREGFFQLLFIVCFNIAMVLICIKRVKKSRILNIILSVICACTYVMTASSAFRMMMYVEQYHLTFLRILVLWFLGLLSVLMAGVIILLWKSSFPLFRYFLTVISVGYLIFAYMKPDLVIARYNINHIEKMDSLDIGYLTENLSADAAPAIAELEYDHLTENAKKLFSSPGALPSEYKIVLSYMRDKMDWRTYNFSYGRAMKMLD